MGRMTVADAENRDAGEAWKGASPADSARRDNAAETKPRWVPRNFTGPAGIVLAIGSAATAYVLRDLAIRPEHVTPMLAITAVLVLYRIGMTWFPASLTVRRIGFWTTLALTFVLVGISPFAGIYAFLGYFDAPSVHKGWMRGLAMGLVAASLALSQSGGFVSPMASFGLFMVFFAVNVGIAIMVNFLEERRERFVVTLQTTVDELQAAEERNRALQEQLLTQARETGIADERARLSREIHDTVAQGLVAIITQLEAADADSPDREARLARASTSARDALAEARRAVRALASPRLDDESLPAAVRALTGQVATAAGLESRFEVDGEPMATEGDGELLRVAQEALSNVVRHAQARRVAVTLSYLPEEVRLDVRDDGRGFDARALADGHGLPGMRQRMRALGGTLDIETREGEGCAISAAVPT
ncbi:Histidine kinase [Gulosibacter molinativorax]|nr:Histidine kinase [Gulosibacter molinativorax]